MLYTLEASQLARMVRKQIYITEEQDRSLKKRVVESGLSEAELIRRSLDMQLKGPAATAKEGLTPPAMIRDPEAWQAYCAIVESRVSLEVPQESWKFNREELYEERLGRWLNPPDP